MEPENTPLLEKEKHLHKPAIFGVPATSFRGSNASFLYEKYRCTIQSLGMKSFQLPTVQIGTITGCFNGISEYLPHYFRQRGVQRVGFLERLSIILHLCLCVPLLWQSTKASS